MYSYRENLVGELFSMLKIWKTRSTKYFHPTSDFGTQVYGARDLQATVRAQQFVLFRGLFRELRERNPWKVNLEKINCYITVSNKGASLRYQIQICILAKKSEFFGKIFIKSKNRKFSSGLGNPKKCLRCWKQLYNSFYL